MTLDRLLDFVLQTFLQFIVLGYLAVLVCFFLPSALNWSIPPPIPALWPQRRAVYNFLSKTGASSVVEVGSGFYPLLVGWTKPALGLELVAVVCACSRLACLLRRSLLMVRRGDALIDLPPADIYVLYLGAELSQRVADKAPNSEVISVSFPINDRPLLGQEDTVLGPVFWYGCKTLAQ